VRTEHLRVLHPDKGVVELILSTRHSVRHAGYRYSGPCAAWAYKTLDLRHAKRVFVLGPSHTYYLRGSALTTFSKYETPFGDLAVDKETIKELCNTRSFANIPSRNDVEEHSLEMHMPYLYKRLEQTFGKDPAAFPPIVPILVGSGDETEEKEMGEILAPYLQKPENAFIISSDFCHWGSNFSYRPHCSPAELAMVLSPDTPPVNGKRVRLTDVRFKVENVTKTPEHGHIHECIKNVDYVAIQAVESGVHAKFVDVLDRTGNTVCGQHPIGVIMAALEILRGQELEDGKGMFKFVQYQRSNLVQRRQDMSVSYCAAYAVL
jgi:AmmeMemoRadiSam system protein B